MSYEKCGGGISMEMDLSTWRSADKTGKPIGKEHA